MKHLDERVVLDLVGGKLDAATAETARKHIDICDSCRDLVAETATSAPANIGRYQIERVAGSGAMGIVYEAIDPQLGRPVAIKLLRNEGDSERLLREARAVAQLSHPNVIAVYDSGIADGEVFMVMELIRGVTLREWADKREWSEIVDAWIKAGRGLAAVHAAGLVHRDVKPDNILVASDGRVLLTDFGLVHVERGTSTTINHIDLTQTGAVVGTPVYLAPEILDGGDATVLSDQFSYCVAVHEALTGERPFVGATIAEIRAAIDRGPPRLDKLPAIARGLATSPDARWPSLPALLDEIESRVRGRNRTKWIAGGAIALGVAAVAGGLAMRSLSTDGPTCDAGTHEIASVWNPQVRDRIGAAFEKSQLTYAASTWRVIATTIDDYTQRWATSFDGACNAAHIKKTQSTATFDLRSRCLERRRSELAVTLDLLATADAAQIDRASTTIAGLVSPAVCDDAGALTDVAPIPDNLRTQVTTTQKDLASATAQYAAGKYKPALEAARKVVESAERIGYAPLIAEAHYARAVDAIALEQWDEAKQALDAALLAAERGRDHRTRANIHVRLAALLLKREDQKGALTEVDRGDAIVVGLGGAARERALLADVRGSALGDMGKLPEAVTTLESAVRMYTEAEGPNTIALTSPITKLGYISYQLGNIPGAIEHFERVLQIRRAALGPDHPEVGQTLTDLAYARRDAGKLDEAAKDAEAARVNLKAASGADSPGYWDATRVLVGIHRRRGAYDDAEKLAREVLAASEKHDPKDQRTADALDDLAQTLTRAKKNLEEAIELRKRGLEIRLATHDNKEHTSVLMTTVALAGAMADAKHYKDALPLFEKAQRLADQPDRPPYLAPASRVGRGRCLVEIGRAREAIPILEEAVKLARPDRMDPSLRVDARITLAMATWAAGDRKAAKASAELAKTEATELGSKELVDQATEWLATHQ